LKNKKQKFFLLTLIIIAIGIIFLNKYIINLKKTDCNDSDCADIKVEEIYQYNSNFPEFKSFKLKNSNCSDYCFIKYIEDRYGYKYRGDLYLSMYYCFETSNLSRDISFIKVVLDNNYVQFNETLSP